MRWRPAHCSGSPNRRHSGRAGAIAGLDSGEELTGVVLRVLVVAALPDVDLGAAEQVGDVEGITQDLEDRVGRALEVGEGVDLGDRLVLRGVAQVIEGEATGLDGGLDLEGGGEVGRVLLEILPADPAREVGPGLDRGGEGRRSFLLDRLFDCQLTLP